MEERQKGALQIKASAASQSLPLENVAVKITGADEENGRVQFSALTDKNGITTDILLPAPNEIYSLTPQEAQKPYYIYDVTLSKSGFYTKRISNVPIFGNKKAYLPIQMIPISYEEENLINRPENINSDISNDT